MGVFLSGTTTAYAGLLENKHHWRWRLPARFGHRLPVTFLSKVPAAGRSPPSSSLPSSFKSPGCKCASRRRSSTVAIAICGAPTLRLVNVPQPECAQEQTGLFPFTPRATFEQSRRLRMLPPPSGLRARNRELWTCFLLNRGGPAVAFGEARLKRERVANLK